MVSYSEEQIYEMKRGPGQDSYGVRVRLKIQRVETRATILRTWDQNRVYLVSKCLQTSLVVLLQSLLCMKKGWESKSELLPRGTWHTGRLEKEFLLPPAGLFMQNGKLNQVTGEVPSTHEHCDSVLAPVTPQ